MWMVIKTLESGRTEVVYRFVSPRKDSVRNKCFKSSVSSPYGGTSGQSSIGAVVSHRVLRRSTWRRTFRTSSMRSAPSGIGRSASSFPPFLNDYAKMPNTAPQTISGSGFLVSQYKAGKKTP
jgi:hypothetical protein